MLQSLFSHTNSSEKKKERKVLKSVQTKHLTYQSVNTVLSTSSSGSSKDREKKRAEKAAKRARLAAELKAKRESMEKGPWIPSGAGTAVATWEESGAMYSMDGIL